MIRAGIIGAAGYTGGELIRLLLRHEGVHIAWAVSESQAGKPYHQVHQDLIGETNDQFVSEPGPDADVVFLCMGHGRSKAFFEDHTIPRDVKVIDLSHDYRLNRGTHPFTYGLPEAFRDQIRQASHIANPGCFATAIQLGLLPLAASGKLSSREVHIHAITGSTGAGQALSETTHFTWRESNVSIYKPFRHQHEGEIKETLASYGHKVPQLRFIPVRGNFTRGIYASMYTPFDGDSEAARQLFESFYQEHPFAIISDSQPDLKQVVNTNKCLIHVDVIDGNLLIISMIDNLVKGASGQAVQNMNLLFGLPETTGLWLKPSAF